MNMVNFLDGLDGLAAGRRRDRRPDVRRDRALAREAGRRDPLGDRLRRLPRLPAPQLLSGADLHGRLGRLAARVRARDRLRAGPAEDGGDRRPLLPAARARGADRRHDVRRRAAAEAPREGVRGRPGAPAPSLPAPRVLASRARRSTIWAWCLSLAAAALATRFIPFRAHGVWHLWPTIAAACDRARRARVLGLRRLRARDRQGREPVPARGARPTIRCGRAPSASRKRDAGEAERAAEVREPMPASRRARASRAGSRAAGRGTSSPRGGRRRYARSANAHVHEAERGRTRRRGRRASRSRRRARRRSSCASCGRRTARQATAPITQQRKIVCVPVAACARPPSARRHRLQYAHGGCEAEEDAASSSRCGSSSRPRSRTRRRTRPRSRRRAHAGSPRASSRPARIAIRTGPTLTSIAAVPASTRRSPAFNAML